MTTEPFARKALRITAQYRLLLVIALLLFIFGFLADEVNEGGTLAFDRSVLMMLRAAGDATRPIGPVWLPEAVRDVTALGSYSVLTILIAAVAMALIFMRQRATALFIIFAVLGGTALSSFLKAIFDRPRPDLTGIATVFTSSFPSGHATVSAVAYLTLGACLTETTDNFRLKAFYLGYGIFLTGIVGLSRLYLGVHYPTDVVAGWAIGASWALLCWVAMRLLFPLHPSTSLTKL